MYDGVDLFGLKHEIVCMIYHVDHVQPTQQGSHLLGFFPFFIFKKCVE